MSTKIRMVRVAAGAVILMCAGILRAPSNLAASAGGNPALLPSACKDTPEYIGCFHHEPGIDVLTMNQYCAGFGCATCVPSSTGYCEGFGAYDRAR